MKQREPSVRSLCSEKTQCSTEAEKEPKAAAGF